MVKLRPVKMTAAGQISIPKPLREGFCQPGDYLSLEPYADGLLLRRLTPHEETEPSPMIETDAPGKDEPGKPGPIRVGGDRLSWKPTRILDAEPPAKVVPGKAPATDHEPSGPKESKTGAEARPDEAPSQERRKQMWKALLDSRAE